MELDKKQTLTPLNRHVSETGIQEIHNYIRSELNRETYLYLPLSWTWEWLVTQGQYRGKLPNRLAHLVKTRYDVKLTPEQKSFIGNIARKHLLIKDNYTIDFTEYFDWDAGDFGDYGSCFWGNSLGALQVMTDEGVIAIRFYDKGGEGTGRAWIYELSANAWVLFNAYGLDCSAAASIFTMKLKEDTGDIWGYEQLDSLRINGITRGFVYINNAPQIVYREGYDRELSVDLDWDVPYYSCILCREWLNEDDAHWDKNGDGPMCRDCYEKLLDKREGERLAELEELEEAEFMDNAARAETAHTMAQETIRNNITAQLVAGQLCLGVEYQVNLFYG